MLPYADQATIADWALPHVRALYAEGIMQGTVVDGVSVFQPTAGTTRAQVMTVIGRTIERGYSYTTPVFDDFASVPYWAQDHVSLLTSLGIVSGMAAPTMLRRSMVSPAGSWPRFSSNCTDIDLKEGVNRLWT